MENNSLLLLNESTTCSFQGHSRSDIKLYRFRSKETTSRNSYRELGKSFRRKRRNSKISLRLSNLDKNIGKTDKPTERFQTKLISIERVKVVPERRLAIVISRTGAIRHSDVQSQIVLLGNEISFFR